MNGVKSIAAAKSKGAKVMDINQVTFAAPVFVTSTGASEPALSGAVAVTKKGAFCAKPVKGQAGVYVFQVTDKTKRNVKYDQNPWRASSRSVACNTPATSCRSFTSMARW